MHLPRAVIKQHSISSLDRFLEEKGLIPSDNLGHDQIKTIFNGERFVRGPFKAFAQQIHINLHLRWWASHHFLPPTHTHRAMNLRSGLTYIIVNRKTRLVLDDPVREGGSVIVNHLNKEDTQKVRGSASHRRRLPIFHNLPRLYVSVDGLPGPRRPLDSSKRQKR